MNKTFKQIYYDLNAKKKKDRISRATKKFIVCSENINEEYAGDIRRGNVNILNNEYLFVIRFIPETKVFSIIYEDNERDAIEQYLNNFNTMKNFCEENAKEKEELTFYDIFDSTREFEFNCENCNHSYFLPLLLLEDFNQTPTCFYCQENPIVRFLNII